MFSPYSVLRLRAVHTVWFQEVGVCVESCSSELLACLPLSVHITIVTYLSWLWQKKWLSYTLKALHVRENLRKVKQDDQDEMLPSG